MGHRYQELKALEEEVKKKQEEWYELFQRNHRELVGRGWTKQNEVRAELEKLRIECMEVRREHRNKINKAETKFLAFKRRQHVFGVDRGSLQKVRMQDAGG